MFAGQTFVQHGIADENGNSVISSVVQFVLVNISDAGVETGQLCLIDLCEKRAVSFSQRNRSGSALSRRLTVTGVRRHVLVHWDCRFRPEGVNCRRNRPEELVHLNRHRLYPRHSEPDQQSDPAGIQA